MVRPDLPVDDVLDDVRAALRSHRAVVIEAPPGAGKTTRVPPALATEPWAGEGRIVVLEPRRVAARAAARRMADERGEKVGDSVGLTTRDDRRTSRQTRIEVVTEGVLVRRLQRDPSLRGTAAVVLDEFHERSIDADLALAFSIESQHALREDLRLVVMSATLDGARMASMLAGAPTVVSYGRLHPVEVEHLDRDPTAPLAPDVAGAVHRALDEHDGDVLVFLPGVREITGAARAIGDPAGVEVRPLHGRLPAKDQDAALRPAPAGRRAVVLSTDLAESSVTVPGVRVVVDAGLSREPRFDARTGMSRLVTVRASRASADQRAGRAGRVASGVALRLWSLADHAARDPHPRPEILQADVAPAVLQVAAWGADLDDLALLDRPPEHVLAAARHVLQVLGAVGEEGRITAHGRDLAALPTHPRLGHLLLHARDTGTLDLGARIAALLTERDVLPADRARRDADLRSRLDVLDGGGGARGRIAAVQREARRLARATTRLDPTADDTAVRDGTVSAGALLARAYPDRVGLRRSGRGTFVLSSGRGAMVRDGDPLADTEALVVADVDDRGRDALVRLAAPTTVEELRTTLADHLDAQDVVAWDDEADDVVAERRTVLGTLVLASAPLASPDPERVRDALLDGVRQHGLGLLGWTPASESLRHRAAFVRRYVDPDWPDVTDDALLASLDTWLRPFLATARRRIDLARLDLHDPLRSWLGWDRARQLDELAPTHLVVPSGSRVRLDYDDPEGPVLAVKLQEMFGATRTPEVSGHPVLVHLLSPARRPLQVTRDLASFWDRGYAAVRAEMRGRYPKHPWPEDPRTAVATARTRRRT